MKKEQGVTEAEFAVLQSLWEHGPSTTRQLAERLYPKRHGAPATVLKLLERLEAKQCVARDDGEPAQVFRALVERDDLIARRLNAVAEDLCDGSHTPLLLHLVDPKRLTSEEIDMLRKLVNDLEKSPRRKKRH